MDYRIEKRDAFNVIGLVEEMTTKDGENLRRIPQLWIEANENGTSDKLIELGEDKDLLGICSDMNHDKETFSYWIAVEATPETDAQGFASTTIPAASWAVFTSVGPMPDAIQQVWARIFQEWFPSTGYEHTGGPEFELYLPGRPDAEDYRCEIWIPVTKKNRTKKTIEIPIVFFL